MRRIRTIEQERASFCLKKIKEIKEKGEDWEKFKTSAKSLPQFIVSDGLLPTLAFYKAKSEKKEVYNLLNEWLQKEKRMVKSDSLKELAEADVQTLRLATMEALALANWLKRLVEAESKED